MRQSSSRRPEPSSSSILIPGTAVHSIGLANHAGLCQKAGVSRTPFSSVCPSTAPALLRRWSWVPGIASLGGGWTTSSIQRLRARACEVRPLGALERKPRDQPPVAAKVTGEVEAAMVKIACSDAPEGHSTWTMSLIAGRLVELGLVKSISGETVRVTLKKTISSRGSRNAGASRPKRTRPS